MNDINFDERLERLDEHIAAIEKALSYAEQLHGDTEAFARYLGGLRQAREIMTGSDGQGDDAPAEAEAS